jgi:hypothetical protein
LTDLINTIVAADLEIAGVRRMGSLASADGFCTAVRDLPAIVGAKEAG